MSRRNVTISHSHTTQHSELVKESPDRERDRQTDKTGFSPKVLGDHDLKTSHIADTWHCAGTLCLDVCVDRGEKKKRGGAACILVSQICLWASG